MSPEIKVKLIVLTAADAARYAKLEEIIKAGRDAFVAVCLALVEIHDSGLYKSTHTTFEAYCIERWGFKRFYAHRLIDAAKISEEMLPTGNIPNERVARALKKLPTGSRKGVFKNALAIAKAAGRPVTSKDVAQASQLASPLIATQPTTLKSDKVNSAEREPVPETITPQAKSGGENNAAKEKAVVPPVVEPLIEAAISITSQMKKLWVKASSTERENFLMWVQEQAAKDKPRYECDSCEETFEDNTDVVTIYECRPCDIKFTQETSMNGNRQCPDCGKLGALFTSRGCPECNEGELNEIDDK